MEVTGWDVNCDAAGVPLLCVSIEGVVLISYCGPVQNSGLWIVENLRGDSEEDTELLRGMADEARRFLNQFGWSKEIREFYFGLGIGGVLAVFLARILPSHEH